MTVQVEISAQTAAKLQAIAAALQLSLEGYLEKVTELVPLPETLALNGQAPTTAAKTPFELGQAFIGAIDSSVPDPHPAAQPHDTVIGRLVAEKLKKQGLKTSKGKTVKVLAADTEISTQRAAKLLHVSHPFLLDLLEKKQIPFHRVGSQRRVRLADVLAYKQRTDEQRMTALDELTRMSQELGLGYD